MTDKANKNLKLYLGARVAEYRERVRPKLSQDKLAKMVGSSRQHLGAIERGETFPSLDLMVLLSLALKVPMKAFFPNFNLNKKPTETTILIDDMVNDVVQLAPREQRVASLILRTLRENLGPDSDVRNDK